MEEQKRNSLDEAANTAHTAAGAIRTGKAVAAAARGTAVGGPFGAVAGAVWGSKKQIGMIALVIIVVLLLPVMFILMLPSLIFGAIFGPGDPDSSAEPIMNNNLAITENINEIGFAVSRVLGEGIDDVEARIQQDFAGTGGDHYEIVTPYAASLTNNTNAFIGQYCAAKNEDWENISLSDLEQILRNHKEVLYTYTRTAETRTIPDDPETEKDESGTETWYIYTIVYQGESYFADEIFQLSADQKELADNYTQNLSLFLGDGMFQYTGGSPSIPPLGDICFTDGITQVIYFNQLDERYASKPYGTDHIGGYGCGPTAMSIVVSSLTGSIVDPVEMSAWAYENGYWCSKSGSYHSLIPGAAQAWDLPVTSCTAAEPQRIVDALSQGKLVVALMGKGHFTSSGHFMVLRGVTSDGKILVADPASYTRSEKEWDLPIILNEASTRAGSGGPFWIIG